MVLINTSLEKFANVIKEENKKIIVYGVGVIGRIVTPYRLIELGIVENVLFWADVDKSKQGKFVLVGNRKIEICNPSCIGKVQEDFVILVTGSRYENIVSSLESMRELDEINGYILPQMLAQKAKFVQKQDVIRKLDKQIIPKKIHYCWFGGNEIPIQIQRCIESWKKYCPDYEIIQWDETNYDVSKYLYTKQAYEHQKWAFVSDVARLDILYQYGGIYMDTDVELVKNLDELLYQSGFCSVEKWGVINTGGGCGVIPEHPIINEMLELRKNIPFVQEDGSLNLESSGSYESLPLLELGFVPNNTTQCVKDMTIYSSDFFHPYDYMTKETDITVNTYGIHHFGGSWI